MYLDSNNLYGWMMSQKLPVNEFKWENDISRFNEEFIKNYDENSDVEYFLEVDIEYPKKLFDSHKDLPFLGHKKNQKKLVFTLKGKEKHVIHIRALKQALNNSLKLKEVHRVIKFNQEGWLNSYIDINTNLRKKAKNYFGKDFFTLINNSAFGKTIENVRKQRDIKLVTTEEKRMKLVSEPNYHTTKRFSKNLLAIEMKKTKVKMNKPVYLGMSVLDISKTLMYEFWYEYIKPKYKDNAKLCYMDADNFIISIKTEDFYKDIANDVERWYDTSKYDENDKIPLPIGKNKKAIGFFKDELDGKIMIKFIALRAKAYAYLKEDGSEHKREKCTKTCIIKHNLLFENYRESLFNSKL